MPRQSEDITFSATAFFFNPQRLQINTYCSHLLLNKWRGWWANLVTVFLLEEGKCPMPSCATTSSPRAAGKRPTRKNCAAGSVSKHCSCSADWSSSSMAMPGSDQTYLPRASTSHFSAKYCQVPAKYLQEPQGRLSSYGPRSGGSCHNESVSQELSLRHFAAMGTRSNIVRAVSFLLP